MKKTSSLKIAGKEAWTTTYDGHEIKVCNGAVTRMFIDGKEVAKQNTLISTSVTLKAVIPGTTKIIMAIVHSRTASDLILSCDFILGDLMPSQCGYQQKDGTIVPLTNEELAEYVKVKMEELLDPTPLIIAALVLLP